MTGPGDRSPFDPATMRQRGQDPHRRLLPMPLGNIFEVSARILRRHRAPLLGLSMLIGLPAALLAAAAGIPFGEALVNVLPETGSTEQIVVSDAQARQLGEGLLIAVAGSLIAGILFAVAAVGFAWVVALDYHGRTVTFADTVSRSVGRALPALATSLLAGLATIGIMLLGGLGVVAILAVLAPGGASGGGVGVFLAIMVGVVAFLAIVILSVRWSLAISVVAVEPGGPIAALRRSWHLTGEATWRTFAALLMVNLIVGVLSLLVTQLLAIVVVDLVAAPVGWTTVGSMLVDTLAAVIFAPVSVVVMTAYLYDQMVRRDGWDLPGAEVVPTPPGERTPGT